MSNKSLGWLLVVVGCGTTVVPVDTDSDEGSSGSSGPTSSSSATVSTSSSSGTTDVTTSTTTATESSGEGGSVSTGEPGSSSEGGSSSSEGSGSGSSSEGESSSSTGTSECTPADECVSDDDCPLEGSVCIACLCIGGEGCVSFGDGEFGDCLTDGTPACMDDEAICVVDAAGDPQLGACASPCEDVCDCPVPPEGFEDQLACDAITLEDDKCFISCADGLPCPDGWTCLANIICMVGEITELDPYGDCANLSGDCPEGEVGGPLCVAFLEGEVCTVVGCDDPTDCADAPPTGTATVACIDLTGEAGGDCYLDCSGGETCPDGMECHGDFGVCYWPPA